MNQPPPLASWHALCLDANDQPRLAEFWATVIARRPDSHDPTHLVGGTDAEQVWVDHVPEPKVAKNRVHWDVRVPAVAPLVERGASVLREPDADISWHVMADPEGNEFCAFTP